MATRLPDPSIAFHPEDGVSFSSSALTFSFTYSPHLHDEAEEEERFRGTLTVFRVSRDESAFATILRMTKRFD